MRDDVADDQAFVRRDADIFMSALLVGHHREAENLVQGWITRGQSYSVICSAAIQPAMIRIGDLWARGQISVAQEHMASAIAQRILVQALDATTFAAPNGQKALFACVEGNRHALGLRMVSDAFSIAGWDVEYLGADVPTEDLVRQVVAWQPHLVGLSVSQVEQVPRADDVARSIRDNVGDPSPRIVVGGRAIRDVVTLPSLAHGDVWPADAWEAPANL